MEKNKTKQKKKKQPVSKNKKTVGANDYSPVHGADTPARPDEAKIKTAIQQQILQQQKPKKEPESFSDPLLECLVMLTKINGNPFSAHALYALRRA